MIVIGSSEKKVSAPQNYTICGENYFDREKFNLFLKFFFTRIPILVHSRSQNEPRFRLITVWNISLRNLYNSVKPKSAIGVDISWYSTAAVFLLSGFQLTGSCLERLKAIFSVFDLFRTVITLKF